MHDNKNEAGNLLPSVVNYSYNENPVCFHINENVMVSATNMAKSFRKRAVDWLKYQQSQEFLNELSKVRKIALADLVRVKKGGNDAGTWFHEDVALEFARWLSPAFAIWCNDRIKEILIARLNGASLVQPAPVVKQGIDLSSKVNKWGLCFNEAMATVKSMQKSNEMLRSNMEYNANTLHNFVQSYIVPDNGDTHVPPKIFEFIVNLGDTIQSQQKTIDFLMKGDRL